MKALLVILNKDNAKALEECLDSVRKMGGLCELFDVLIIDGGSRDNSREVAEKFMQDCSCIKFVVQRRLGGTGYARREACEYATKNGYDVIIWGDSENVYDENYAVSLLNALKDSDIAGGVPVVDGGFYAHAFAWYHAIHIIIPGLHKIHIPGNNKGEWVRVCKKIKYPETLRSDDYGFSLLAKKMGIKFRQKIAEKAIVYVKVPENMHEVMRWQRARIKGAVQVLKKVGIKPWDQLGLGFLSLLFPILALFAIISFYPLAIYSIMFIAGTLWLFAKEWKNLKNPKLRFFFAPAIGVLIYSIYSFKAFLLYFRKFRS